MKTFEISDGELIAAYLEGNENAFAQLVKRHKNKVFTSVCLIVKDKCAAEDILQEVFIKAVTKIKQGAYKDEGKFLPWVCRIAHNMAIDFFRKAKRYPTIVLEDGSSLFDSLEFSEASCEVEQIKQDTYAKLRVLIQHLPEAQKEVLVMRHYMQLSFNEIAELTGVSINTALGRMRYALINLKKQMNQNDITYVDKT